MSNGNGGLIGEDFARDVAEMLRWFKRNRHQLAQTQAMAYREGPEDYDPWYYLYNGRPDTILQYSPCAINGPNMNPGDQGYSPTDFASWDRTLYGFKYPSGGGNGSEHYYWRSWGVALEEIPSGSIGKVAISGTVPCRMKGTPRFVVGVSPFTVTMAAVPVPGESWVRPASNGTAYFHDGHYTAEDADGVRLCWLTLGKDAGFIGHSMYSSSEGTTISDDTAKCYGSGAGYTINRNCLTIPYQKAAGSISWGGRTALETDARGIEAVDSVFVIAESTAVVRPYSTPSTADGAHTIYGSFVILDESGNYLSEAGASFGNWWQDYNSVPTSPPYDLRHIPNHCQTINFKTVYDLRNGRRMFPVLYRTAGNDMTFKIESWNTTFTELPEGVLQ